jgi:hypothetical protein
VIVRDEARYIDEWVDYNLQVLKFSAIFIYDNSDDTQIKEWAKRQNNTGVFVTDIRGSLAQPMAFKACANRAKREGYDFAFFADTDEYLALFLKKHRDITDFANEYLTDPVGNSSLRDKKSHPIGSVCMNWRILGTSGHLDYTPVPLSKRFQLRVPDTYGRNKWIKCFTRLDAVDTSADFHCPHNIPLKKGWKRVNTNRETFCCNGRFKDRKHFNIAAIYHYYFKSNAEYIRKRKRGGGTFGASNDSIKMAEQGFDINATPLPVGEVKDDFIWKQLTYHVEKYTQYEA